MSPERGAGKCPYGNLLAGASSHLDLISAHDDFSVFEISTSRLVKSFRAQATFSDFPEELVDELDPFEFVEAEPDDDAESDDFDSVFAPESDFVSEDADSDSVFCFVPLDLAPLSDRLSLR
jgi:hypothetical protein